MANEIRKYCESCKFYSVLGCQSTLICRDGNRFIVADVQPVKHGRWEEIEEYDGWGDTYFRCSICGDEWDLDAGTPVENGMKYCPNCGARMDGDTE